MRRALLMTACLVGLSACSSSSASQVAPTLTVTATQTATATVTATQTASAPASALEFVPASLDDLFSRAVEEGLLCDQWDVITSSSDMASAKCSDLILVHWSADTDGGRRWHKSTVNLGLTAITSQQRADVSLLVGRNWSMRLATEDAYAFQKRMGGTVLGYPIGS